MRIAPTISGLEFQKRYLSAFRRVLLVSPPVYDYRLEWPQWHQPAGLLQLAALLRAHKKSVRLIDCFFAERGERLRRRKVSAIEIEGHIFNKWQFGVTPEKVEAQVVQWAEDGWTPQAVLITSINSIYWESARDMIAHLRPLLPQAKFILGGVYPTVEPEHAAQHSGADVVVTGSVPAAADLPPDLSLYPTTPYAAGIYFYATANVSNGSRVSKPRAVTKIVKEIKDKIALGAHEFVFFDEEIRLEHRDHFAKLLDAIAEAELDAHFVLPGNISPRTITQDLSRKLRLARFTQIYLHCDLIYGLDSIQYATKLSEYERCVNALIKTGAVKAREGNVVAMLVAGFPYEDLEAVSERLIHLAHIVGSVTLVPIQYVPSFHTSQPFQRALTQNGHFTPEKFNSKLFPLARLSGKTLEEYLELTRLAVLLNSKYRSKTFDFLDDSIAARLFRESLRTAGWNPFSNVDRPLDTDTSDIPVLAIPEGHSHDHP